MATARPAGLTELARFGFEDLTGAISGLERLVEAIGDLGHTCLAHLGRAQNPDQALRHLIRFASENKSLTRQVLRNEESAARLILIFGASDALADFLHRQPNAIQWLENRHAQLVGQESMASVIRDRVKPQLIANSEIADAWTALRIAYREQLLRVAAFDLQQSQPVANLPKIAAELADLAPQNPEVTLYSTVLARQAEERAVFVGNFVGRHICLCAEAEEGEVIAPVVLALPNAERFQQRRVEL